MTADRYAWLTGYSFAVARAGDVWPPADQPPPERSGEGAVLVALGPELATERR